MAFVYDFELRHIQTCVFMACELRLEGLQLVCSLAALTSKSICVKLRPFPKKVSHAGFFPVDLDCL